MRLGRIDDVAKRVELVPVWELLELGRDLVAAAETRREEPALLASVQVQNEWVVLFGKAV